MKPFSTIGKRQTNQILWLKLRHHRVNQNTVRWFAGLYFACTDRSLLFGIGPQPVPHSRRVFSTEFVSDLKGFNRANFAQTWPTELIVINYSCYADIFFIFKPCEYVFGVN